VKIPASIAVGLLLALTGPAFADRACSTPLADWQPRGALERKLSAEGWTDVAIRSDDGCYKVIGIDPTGERTKARFDPSTLERLGRGGGGGHGPRHRHRGGADGGEDD
jgi:hypothetical protein